MDERNAPQEPEFHSSGEGSARPVSNDAKSSQYRLAKVVIVIAIIVFLVIVFLAIQSCGRFSVYDSHAEEGQLRGKTNAEIEEELSRQVEKGMFNISIASSVELENGTAEGEFRIENVPGNQYHMSVTIVDNETGETLLETGMIRPNQHIWEHALDVNLGPGVYPCTAVFTAYDLDTLDEVGQAAAEITITVDS